MIDVRYDGAIVGQYVADLLIEEDIVVEVKSIKCFDDTHLAQCLNYLKATSKAICLLLNFGSPKVELRRIVHKF
jgi:GxxExxY protein